MLSRSVGLGIDGVVCWRVRFRASPTTLVREAGGLSALPKEPSVAGSARAVPARASDDTVSTSLGQKTLCVLGLEPRRLLKEARGIET